MTTEDIIQECWEWLYWHSDEHLYKDGQGVIHFDSLVAANACKNIWKMQQNANNTYSSTR